MTLKIQKTEIKRNSSSLQTERAASAPARWLLAAGVVGSGNDQVFRPPSQVAPLIDRQLRPLHLHSPRSSGSWQISIFRTARLDLCTVIKELRLAENSRELRRCAGPLAIRPAFRKSVFNVTRAECGVRRASGSERNGLPVA